MKNNLAYFVDEIRTPFVINDIKRIAAQAKSIYLFSVNKLEGKEALPENVTVFESFIDWQNFSPLKIVFANFFSILGIYINECIALRRFLPLKKSIALLASNTYKAECVMEKLNGDCSRLKVNPSTINLPIAIGTPSTFYSFWFYDCIYLAWMRKKGWIAKAVTRTHSGDLYEDHISIRNKILFRNFQFEYLDKVFPVSNMGTEYLKNKYPSYIDEIETIFLGSKCNGINPFDASAVFTMVSCANFRHHKRIHKIAEMLMHIDFPLRWYHIGDERLDSNDPKIQEYKDNKEKLKATKFNIEFIPLGSMRNEAIFEFYNKIPIHLFVSLSAVEGIPVSMMEAISFGIPVLSTDVGGCKEIVTEQTGILIPLESEMQELAQMITEFKDSDKNTAPFRKGVRAFWEEYFDADKNYKAFFEMIG
jgi:glycosyltransferase involved in cell wall biosynthesis